MKILHVLATLDPASGGPTESVLQCGSLLAGQGHAVEVLTLDHVDAPFIREFPLPVHAVGPSWGTFRYSRGLVPWLKFHVGDYDVIIINGIWQYNCFGAWRVLRRSRTPYFVYVHGMLDPWFKRAYPLKHLKKWLFWPWGVYPVLRDARAVLFTCEEERRLARDSFWLYSARERVLKYGTASPPADDAAVREEFLGRYPHIRCVRPILFLSRIHEKKGCDLLIRAFARIHALEPQLHLILAGPGEDALLAHLKALATKLDVSNHITWTGMLTPPLKWAAFYCAEAFILPSHQENFGIAVAEALGCGLPVLISDKVNIWREIEQAGAGFVAPDTVDGTESSLRRWAGLDAAARAEMKIRANATFKEHFTLDAMTTSLLDTLKLESGMLAVAVHE
ncbi:MAG: glycosyltransferase [Pseudomonadota bacterium]|nr:glycosyltransferase [Pseudomonadota bacterium]